MSAQTTFLNSQIIIAVELRHTLISTWKMKFVIPIVIGNNIFDDSLFFHAHPQTPDANGP